MRSEVASCAHASPGGRRGRGARRASSNCGSYDIHSCAMPESDGSVVLLGSGHFRESKGHLISIVDWC